MFYLVGYGRGRPPETLAWAKTLSEAYSLVKLLVEEVERRNLYSVVVTLKDVSGKYGYGY